MRAAPAWPTIPDANQPVFKEAPTVSTVTPERSAANLTTIQQIYAAFGCGDVPAILDVIAPDCRWEAWADNSAQGAGVAYLQPRRGPSGVGEFFAAVAELEIHDFRVLDCIAGPDQVAAEILIDASTPAGGRFRDEELHLWTLDHDGSIVRLRHYVDTAKHIAAAAGEDTTSHARG
jgi:ketosteroid isomerase-like protein